MYQQRDKYNKISLISLSLAIIICFFALIKTSYLLILFSLYSLVISLFTEAVVMLFSHRQTDALKQLIRTVALFIITTFLLIRFIKGL